MGGKRSVLVRKVNGVGLTQPRLESAFDCPRCGGLMSPEHFINRAEGGGDWAYPAWRCVYCGEVIDSLILLNRRRQKDHGETGIKRRGRPSQEAHRPFRS
ncbi:MAG: hypothetical protein WAO55_13675 [Candidatus Manganitrophaceae bacterium]